MDTGHYNCRDYHIGPHFAPTTITSTIATTRSPFYRTPYARHESFDELEQRSRSPASMKPKFPLLQLPLELRQHIFSYLLPRAIEHSPPNPLGNHARNFSAVKKRGARGMIIPQPTDPAHKGPSNIVWQRGNITLLSVCRQIHNECAEMLYSRNTFLLFITYSGITFRYSWLLPAGLTPNRRYNFLELLSHKYMTLIKKVVVNVDHVDSYTSMIKFNVSGKGLTHGLRRQVQRLVNALQPPPEGDENESGCGDDNWTEEERLIKVHIRVSNGNAFLDQVKSEIVRQREGSIKVSEDIQEMLEPFGQLRGVREVNITGAVTPTFSQNLETKMKSIEKPDHALDINRGMRDLDLTPPPQLCVYGNDL